MDQAEIVLDQDEAFAYVKDAGRCLLWAWGACQTRRVELAGSSDAPMTRQDAYALADTVQPHAARLFAVGKHLIRWDGHGPMSVAGLETFERIPPGADDREAWRAAVGDEFAERAKGYGRRRVSVRGQRRR